MRALATDCSARFAPRGPVVDHSLFEMDSAPPEGVPIQALVEDDYGKVYALPFPVVYRDETGCVNPATGEDIEPTSIGWRLWGERV